MSIISMDLSPQVLFILYAIIIGVPLTIWLVFKIYKITEKIKNKKK